MKKILAVVLASSVAASPLAMANEAQYVGESRAAVKQLFKTLKGTLVGAMKAGGPSKAIAACNLNAQPITMGESNRLGYEIGRTSLRLRNPVNAPDAWEIKVLQQFEARASAGEDMMKMEYHEMVETQDGHKQFRYMKAIPAGKPCMACHGELVAPEVLKTIRDLYPMDQATGFKPGDLRGAFTIVRDL